MFAPVRSSFALLLWMWGLAVPVYAQGPAVPLDLTSTTIVVAADASPRERAAATMLLEEVQRRSRARWTIGKAGNGSGSPWL